MFSLISKDAQIFYTDAFIGFTIFVVAIVVFFALSGNASNLEGRVLDALVGDAESVSDSLMSEGYPADWTPTTVSIVGLTDGAFRVNYTKVSMFYGMSHNLTSNLFGTNANYLVFFKDRDGNVLPFSSCAFTNTDIVVQNITPYLCQNVTAPSANQLVSSERLSFYNSKIIKMVVYVWD